MTFLSFLKLEFRFDEPDQSYPLAAKLSSLKLPIFSSVFLPGCQTIREREGLRALYFWHGSEFSDGICRWEPFVFGRRL